MILLADTNILIAVIELETHVLPAAMRAAVLNASETITTSVASLWEIAIKVRLGKLPLKHSLSSLPSVVAAFGFTLLKIDERHVLAELKDVLPTRDPFDRLLLAQCQVENMRLVTLDRALAQHPFAWREA